MSGSVLKLEHSGPPLRSLMFGLICVIAFIAGGVPWYALRSFPIVSLGTAHIHLLDALMALTIVVGVIRFRQARRRWTPLAAACALFTSYMLIPLLRGIADPENAFHAIREMRPFAYYLLGAVLVLEGFRWRECQTVLNALLAGSIVGVAMGFLHACFSVPLPGYMSDASSGLALGSRVQYLEWTVLPVAVLVAVAGTLRGAGSPVRYGYIAGLVALIWYQLAAAARAVQILSFFGGLGLSSVLMARSRRVIVGAVGALLVIGTLGLGFVAQRAEGSSCVILPVGTTVQRWREAHGDRSLQVRIEEVVMGFQAFRKSPLFGLGLGSLLPVPADADPSGQARNIASGFAFVLFKTGVVGLSLYLALLGMALSLAWRKVRLFPSGTAAQALAWTATIGILVLVGLNFVHRVSGVPEGAIVFALFAGVATTRFREELDGASGG